MTSDAINKRLSSFEDGAEDLCYGWWWREVDFDADSVHLAYMPDQAPSWFGLSLEARIGQPYKAEGPRFCENNKWDYPMFNVEGETWAKLRGLCATGTQEEIAAFLNGPEIATARKEE